MDPDFILFGITIVITCPKLAFKLDPRRSMRTKPEMISLYLVGRTTIVWAR
jgi:hypothetical protein